MSEANASLCIKVVVLCETSATHYEDMLRRQGYDPIFCGPADHDCRFARKNMRALIAREVCVAGTVGSRRLKNVIKLAGTLGFPVTHI